MLELIFPTRGEVFSLHRKIHDYRYPTDVAAFSRPMPIPFAWVDSRYENEPDAPYVLTVANDPELKDVVYCEIVCGKKKDVYNLPIGRTYYWGVQNKNRELSNICKFSILFELPRFIEIDNICNVRDIGGYKANGGHVRFGLAFRGPAVDFDENEPEYVSELGRRQMKYLGIKTDLSLLDESDYVDFGFLEDSGIKFIYAGMGAYSATLELCHKEGTKKAIEALADKKNLPVYFHCAAGADRTGTLALILLSILGVSFEDIKADYNTTSLSAHGPRCFDDHFPDFCNKMSRFGADTLQENVVRYIKSELCISDETIQAIRDNFIERDS